ncbi:cytosine permease, partial [Vibrio parahaemolyticus]|uniref:cytosine permease n=1 Tax=Vibrio parahaemolyticus TaxID=670 RepID=UPI00146F4B5A
EDGVYSYNRGYNWRAIAALILAILPVIPGFLRAAVTPGGQIADPGLLDSIYNYAWFITFGIAFLVYYLLMKYKPQSP